MTDKVFSALSDEVKAAKFGLQVIVLDHADEQVWGTVEHKFVVEEWRNGKKLVPKEWIDESPRGF